MSRERIGSAVATFGCAVPRRGDRRPASETRVDDQRTPGSDAFPLSSLIFPCVVDARSATGRYRMKPDRDSLTAGKRALYFFFLLGMPFPRYVTTRYGTVLHSAARTRQGATTHARDTTRSRA